MSDPNSKKRKGPGEAPNPAKRPRFPQRAQAYQISTTPTTTAYPDGEINVKSFLNSHQNEIKSLENAMRAAKKGLSRRAFQDVPRELRRRTASHNPRRVPNRLRARAHHEAKEDNTPISRGTSGSGIGKEKKKWLRKEGIEKSRKGWEDRKRRREEKKRDDKDTGEAMEGVEVEKDTPATTKQPAKKAKRKFALLATPETPPSRFRRRQRDKTWLPTHIWHTKRARMTLPTEPLWRFAIPLAPAVKAYRLTHRAATMRGAVAWDMSYVSTISLEGVETSIVRLLKALHFSQETEDDPWQERGKAKKWKKGTRMWEGWLYEREGKEPKGVAPVTVIWSVTEEGSTKRKAFIRIHPCAFLQLWNEVIRIAKVQKPAVTVEDLRFEIGSIEIMGPGAAETLCSILHPSSASESSSPQALWPSLASVTDPGVLPPGALLAFPISDPRLRDPPRASQIAQDAESQVSFMETIAMWPIDGSQPASAIFDRNARLAAARSLPSQKSINRRKSTEGDFGEYPPSQQTDPQIPMLLYVSQKSKSWTILLPWKCVMPVWRGIMRYPLSTGGNPRFGGLKERRQVYFERSVPSFPFDYPGCEAGWGWELQERAVREHEWTKRPKGKRIEWSTIDLDSGRKGELGDPWACDWERLVQKEGGDVSMNGTEDRTTQSSLRQWPSRDAREVLAGRPISPEYLSILHLFTVKISMVQRGTPTTCARIYRLPTNNTELRSKWLSLLPSANSSSRKMAERKTQPTSDQPLPEQIQRRDLARSLLEPPLVRNGPPKAGEEDYPVVPDEEELIGFVTTGNYNLAEGMPTAVANLVLHRVIEKSDDWKGLDKERRVCIVREAGRTIGRLATWETPPATMSEDNPADSAGGDAPEAIALAQGALEELTRDILESCIQNIIHSTAISCHRTEKQLRMQSAATSAESLALANLELPSQKNSQSNTQPSLPKAETDAALYENGRVFLKGNPLKTTPEIICPHCKLPRLMHPMMGKGMQQPDLTREYCMLYPWVQRPGHDVYGNPFPTDMTKTKKERELLKQQQKAADNQSVGTPGSQDTDMNAGDGTHKLNTGGKPASYIPWHTCPKCKRSLLITRFAHHLDKCLGISGRQSSRNAMAKISGVNGNSSGVGNTPIGSRLGTPAPGSQGDGPIPKSKAKGISPVKNLRDNADDDEGENDTPEKKKKKTKSSYVKKADREKMAKEGTPSGTLKVKLKTGNPNSERRDSNMSEKRDRESESIDPEGAPKAKKIKLSIGKAGSPPAPTPTTQGSPGAS
ncbi:ribonuclease P complex subunit Pop1 [Bimuria novae-zelandiae CBS 107.79]|uniref:SAGA-associated factor 11 n=1 Tax=Bimuria novae-zelandiae CBS 107.79 TaxID=1447943 RepID=A0A6A5VKF8_9PLEO|nr:ribonuclease P complex subunit Pop1 [Bimuria novae-zelandiae CBS 107.79]